MVFLLGIQDWFEKGKAMLNTQHRFSFEGFLTIKVLISF